MEGGQLTFEGSKVSLQGFIEEWNARVDRRKKQVELNESVLYDEVEKLVKGKRLDSNLKKCTAFVRKMRTIHESVKISLENDVRTLNLTKYLSEIILGILEAKLKPADIPSLMSVCSEIQRRYRKFSVELLENFRRILEASDLTSIPKASADIRLFCEFIVAGVLPKQEASELLMQTLQRLVTLDKHGSHCMPLLANMLRDMTDELIDVVPRDVRLTLENAVCLSKLHRSTNVGLSTAFRTKIKALIKKYFLLVRSVQTRKNDNIWGSAKYLRKLLENKGEFPPEREKEHDSLVEELEKYHSQLAKLANLIDIQAPKLYYLSKNPDEDFEQSLNGIVEDSGGRGALFDDDETKQFYLELPDMKAYLFERKNVNLKTTSNKESSGSTKDPVHTANDGGESDDSCSSDDSTSSIDIDGLQSDPSGNSDLDEFDTEDLKKELMQLKDELPSDPGVTDSVVSMGEEDDDSVVSRESSVEKIPTLPETSQFRSYKMSFSVYLQHLKTCVNKTMIDNAAYHFVANFRSKKLRAELARYAFNIGRQRMDLTRLLARLIANLSQVYPEIGQEVCDQLRKEVRFVILKRDQQRLEQKLRVARYIGELVMFSVMSKNEAFNQMKLLLRNFTHHQIDMMCCLLETCGRFLYRSKESHRRMKLYLDEMIRRKNTQFMEGRYAYQVECAYSQICRTSSVKTVKQRKAPIQALMEYVLRYDLASDTVTRACNILKLFDWDDPGKREMVIGILAAPWRLNYSQLEPAAAVLAYLHKIRPTAAQAVIENVSEFVRLGCEFESEDINNMRMSTCQYLSYLFNNKCISTTTILNVMYYLISFGVTYQNNVFTNMDPPDSVQRVRIICHMLQINGENFNTPLEKQRLEYFLKYFQRYYLYKKELPIWDVDGWQRFPHYVSETFEDTLKAVNIDWVFANTLAEAEQNIMSVDKQLREKATKRYVIRNAIRERRNRTKGALDIKKSIIVKSQCKTRSDAYTQDDVEDQSTEEDEFEKEFRSLCAEGGGDLVSKYPAYSTVNRRADIPTAKMLGVSKSGIADLTGGSSHVKVTILTKHNNKPQEKTLDMEVKQEFFACIKERGEKELQEKSEVKSRILELSRRQQAEEQDAKHAEMMKALRKLGKVAVAPASPKRVNQKPKRSS